MIAIGTSLREARERRGLEYAQIEAATRIRAGHLRALEAERFDELPARVYARAFLVEYADFLGLDSEQFANEFDARFPVVEEEDVALLHPQPRRVPHRSGVVAAVVLALAVLGVLGWKIGQGNSPPATAPPPRTTEPTAARQPTTTHAGPRSAPIFTLVAARGRCWVDAHAGSRDGRLLYQGTLELAQRLRLPARRLWLRIGAPWNVDARLNGKHVALPDHVADLVVTPAAVRVATA